MKHETKEKYQSLAGYLSGRSEGDKSSHFPRGFVVSKNENSKAKKRIQSSLYCRGKDDPKEPVILPPVIGWVYLVQEVRRLDDTFSEFDPKGKRTGISLVGFGIPKKEPTKKMFYDANMFRVVGKAKMISPQ